MEWIIGVVFAVASCAVSNLGLNLQKLCHNRNNAAEKRGEKVKPYTTQPVWILGFTMVWVGSVLDFVALGFAAQTVIAPLGSLTLVTNVYFAPYFNGEKASRKDLVATAVIVVGSATAVAFGDHSDAELSHDDIYNIFTGLRFGIYASFMFIWIVFMFASLQRTALVVRRLQSATTVAEINACRRMKKLNRFLYASVSGIAGAQSVLFAKTLSSFVRGGFLGMWLLPGFYATLIAMLLTIFLQISWVNDGLRLYDALYIVPVFQSFWIVFSVISGLIVYGEADNLAPFQACMFLLGISVAVVGVYSLAQRRGSDTEAMMEKRRSSSSVLRDGAGGYRRGVSGMSVLEPVSELADLDVDSCSETSASGSESSDVDVQFEDDLPHPQRRLAGASCTEAMPADSETDSDELLQRAKSNAAAATTVMDSALVPMPGDFAPRHKRKHKRRVTPRVATVSTTADTDADAAEPASGSAGGPFRRKHRTRTHASKSLGLERDASMTSPASARTPTYAKSNAAATPPKHARIASMATPPSPHSLPLRSSSPAPRTTPLSKRKSAQTPPLAPFPTAASREEAEALEAELAELQREQEAGPDQDQDQGQDQDQQHQPEMDALGEEEEEELEEDVTLPFNSFLGDQPNTISFTSPALPPIFNPFVVFGHSVPAANPNATSPLVASVSASATPAVARTPPPGAEIPIVDLAADVDAGAPRGDAEPEPPLCAPTLHSSHSRQSSFIANIMGLFSGVRSSGRDAHADVQPQAQPQAEAEAEAVAEAEEVAMSTMEAGILSAMSTAPAGAMVVVTDNRTDGTELPGLVGSPLHPPPPAAADADACQPQPPSIDPFEALWSPISHFRKDRPVPFPDVPVHDLAALLGLAHGATCPADVTGSAGTGSSYSSEAPRLGRDSAPDLLGAVLDVPPSQFQSTQSLRRCESGEATADAVLLDSRASALTSSSAPPPTHFYSHAHPHSHSHSQPESTVPAPLSLSFADPFRETASAGVPRRPSQLEDTDSSGVGESVAPPREFNPFVDVEADVDDPLNRHDGRRGRSSESGVTSTATPTPSSVLAAGLRSAGPLVAVSAASAVASAAVIADSDARTDTRTQHPSLPAPAPALVSEGSDSRSSDQQNRRASSTVPSEE